MQVTTTTAAPCPWTARERRQDHATRAMLDMVAALAAELADALALTGEPTTCPIVGRWIESLPTETE